jgi:c-di-GMP-binding flagellar brake protein YcgR
MDAKKEMQNRRQTYRHVFPPNHRLRASLVEQGEAVGRTGEIVNLSIGGMCVKLDDGVTSPEGNCLVDFVLDGANEVIQIRAERVHAKQDRDLCLGWRFLFPIHAPTRERLERQISKYLIDVQRYQRQLSKESNKTL